MLMITAVWISFYTFNDQLNSQYSNVEGIGSQEGNELNKSRFSMLENKSKNISNEFYNYSKAFRNIQSDDAWPEKLLGGAVAVPKLILNVPADIITAVNMIRENAGQTLKIFGLGAGIITMFTLAILMYAIFKLVGFWRRTPI